MDAVRSKTNVPIRLTEERWFHITEEHLEMAGYYFEVLEAMEEPESIYEGIVSLHIYWKAVQTCDIPGSCWGTKARRQQKYIHK